MYNVTCENIETPSRGWYSIFPFILSRTVDYGELRWSLKDDENLVLARVDINEFKETPISEEALVNLQKMFDFFRQYNKEIILRFVYDTDGNGLMNEPQSISIIKNHMDQLGPVIRKNAGQILTLQGLFFGSWGEMHTSRYSNRDDICDLAVCLFEATGGSVNIALRKPQHIRELIDKLDMMLYRRKEELVRRIGLYDDAMLSSDTDMGTFSIADSSQNIEFFKELSCFNLIGGETVADNPINDGMNAVNGLKERCVTYLNSQYDLAVIEKWKKQTIPERIPGSKRTREVSVYDYVTKYMGYRLELEKVKSQTFGKNVLIYINNTGFAPFYGPVKLIINDDAESEKSGLVINPGQTEIFTFNKSQIPKSFTLSCVRISDGKQIGIYNVQQ